MEKLTFGKYNINTEQSSVYLIVSTVLKNMCAKYTINIIYKYAHNNHLTTWTWSSANE